MKKIFSLLLILCLAVSLCAACGAKNEAAVSTGETDTEAPGTELQSTEEVPTQAELDRTMRVGFGRAEITPDDPVPLAGYGTSYKRISQNVLDKLYTNCIAVSDAENNTVLLFVNDTIDSAYYKEAAAAVSRATGVPESHIMIAGTHTHSAPDVGQSNDSGIINYLNKLYAALSEAGKAAIADQKEASLYDAKGEIVGLNFCRHYLLTNGTYAGDNYGDFTSAPIKSYETEADHEIQLLVFKREGAKDIWVTNFQVHPHRTGGMEKYDISSDIAGSFRDYVESKEDVNCVYMTGAAGNINPTSRIPEDMLTEDYKVWAQIFGDKVIELSGALTPLEGGPVKVTTEAFTGRIDHSMDGMVNLAQTIYTEFQRSGERGRLAEIGAPYGIHSVYHASAIIVKSQLGATGGFNVSTVSFGDVGIACVPYEMIDRNGMAIKANEYQKLTLVMSCCNGSNSYIPADYCYDNTCYEADQCRYEKGTAEKLQEMFLGMLKAQATGETYEAPTQGAEESTQSAENPTQAPVKTLRNLALGSTVTTTYSTGKDIINPVTNLPQYWKEATQSVWNPIENIIDGNTMPIVGTSCQYPWDEDGYILFDLGDEYIVTGTYMYNYEWPYQWCINEAWSVYGSVDGVEFTKLADYAIDTSAFTESVQYASGIRGGQPDGGDFEALTTARYIKLVIDKVFVGAGENTRSVEDIRAGRTTQNGGDWADVRMYEFQIMGYEK